MLANKDKKTIRTYCLQNAVFYNGKANPGAVIGKVMAGHPELRAKISDIKAEVAKQAKEINKLTLEKQKAELEKLAPELLERPEKKERGLAEIEGAVPGKFVTRFAPAPSGALTFVQTLRAAILSWMYAEKYNGKFILRFDDTDPIKIEKEFYTWIAEDLGKLGIKPSSTEYESDMMAEYYKFAEQLLKSGKAYACRCPAEKFRELKEEKRACVCAAEIAESTKLWQKALKGGLETGEIVIRLRTSMKEPNPALRDPPLLRVIDSPHPRVGKKYSVWPLYNFASAVSDHLEGVTHIFRGKEHEHNTAIQNTIHKALGWKPPIVLNFGMVHLPEGKMHKRDVKALVKSGKISGWDDPSLPTLRAFLRRGWHPDAIKQLALQAGLTKTDIKLSWENLESANRKIIDPIANRYFVVIDPVRISVSGCEAKTARHALHPDFPDRGQREIPADPNEIYICKEDFENLKGKEFRLIGLCNIRLKGTKAVCTGDQIIQGMPKIQWVSKQNITVKILKPDQKVSALGEPWMSKLKAGDIIQMERVGFARVDSTGKKDITVVFAHK